MPPKKRAAADKAPQSEQKRPKTAKKPAAASDNVTIADTMANLAPLAADSVAFSSLSSAVDWQTSSLSSSSGLAATTNTTSIKPAAAPPPTTKETTVPSSTNGWPELIPDPLPAIELLSIDWAKVEEDEEEAIDK